MKTISTLLIESNNEKCLTNYGHELFGEIYKKNGEPNTQDERDLIRQIREFTLASYGKDLDTAFVNNLKELKKCIETYSTVLGQTKKIVMRGMSFKNHEDFKKATGLDFTTDMIKAPVKFKYQPNAVIESWTDSIDVATHFAYPMGSKQVAMVIGISTTKNKEDLLFNAKHFSKVSFIPEESELLRFGKTPIEVSAMIYCEADYDELLLAKSPIVNKFKKSIK